MSGLDVFSPPAAMPNSPDAGFRGDGGLQFKTQFTVRSKAVLKQSDDMQSAKLGSLPVGTVVDVLEQRGNRVRTARGWTSVVASSGTVLLEPVAPRPVTTTTVATVASTGAAAAAPDDFRFPFPPYDIQVGFMRHLHQSLREGSPGKPKIAVMESPTGTGKSLSIICGALTWVREARAAQKAAERAAAAGADQQGGAADAEPDWVQAFKPEERQLDEKEFQAKRREKKLRRKLERRLRNGAPPLPTPLPGGEYDDEFLLEQDGGGGGGGKGRRRKRATVGYGSSSSSDSDADDGGGGRSDSSEDEGEDGKPQVLYCSRTHSQLAQFVREINKTAHRNAVHVTTLGSRKNLCVNESVRKLGQQTASVAMMNERCADLRSQKSRKFQKAEADAAGSRGALMGGASKKISQPAGKDSCGCSYSSRKSELLFEQAASERIMDMEDLVALGQQLHACPYYGTRRMAKSGSADVVCLPYSLLFRAEARNALGIKLRGRVVIVDEAHNLHNAINGMHSLSLSAEQFETAIGQLHRYQSRYASRLKPENLQRVNQTLRVLRAMATQLTRPRAVAGAAAKPGGAAPAVIVGVNEYLFAAGLDHVNFFELLGFLEDSMLVNKLSGFVLSTSEQQTQQQAQQQQKQKQQPQKAGAAPRVGAIREVVDFIKALTMADGHGRILTQPPSADGPAQLRFLTLNPASFFTPLLEEVRAVVLAGGTMDPLPTLAADFFPTIKFQKNGAGASGGEGSRSEEEVIRHFSCGHVIAPEQLTTLALCNGPGGLPLDFRASQGRDSNETIDELGRLLRNICAVVRGGVVAFFPSYAYESTCHKRWVATGQYGKIEAVKPNGMFRDMSPEEQQEQPAQGTASSGLEKGAQPAAAPDREQSLNELLVAYAAAVNRTAEEGGGRGAFLSSVVGGKLSEGINFSDCLGRCVIMVGMPYPNPNDTELLERQRFAVSQAGGVEEAGREYYDRLCMRAVNQCIGRAIRHQDDYAAIILLDQRYARPRVMAQLPGWITGVDERKTAGGRSGAGGAGSRVVVAEQFGLAQRELCKFFRAREMAERAAKQAAAAAAAPSW